MQPTVWDPVARHWYFFIDHRGPDPVYNVRAICSVIGSHVPDIRLEYEEVDAQPMLGPMARGQFPLDAPDPNHGYYEAAFAYHGGTAVEDLLIEMIGGKVTIASKVIDKSPKSNKGILLQCKDKGFPKDVGIEQNAPSCWPGFVARDGSKY